MRCFKFSCTCISNSLRLGVPLTCSQKASMLSLWFTSVVKLTCTPALPFSLSCARESVFPPLTFWYQSGPGGQISEPGLSMFFKGFLASGSILPSWGVDPEGCRFNSDMKQTEIMNKPSQRVRGQ